MFGLFRKKTPAPSVTPEDKDWIEKNLIWFIEVFGLDRRRQQPFILPTHENFPYKDFKHPDEFQALFEQLCGIMELDPKEITVKFFDDLKSKQWSIWIPNGQVDDPGGYYYQEYTTTEKRFHIQLAKSNLGNPQLLICVLTHELAHVKLLGGNFIHSNDPDMEPLTDLASIFWGFGIFVANSKLTSDHNWISRTGYLPAQVIAYTNALICYVTNTDPRQYSNYLNANTKALFMNDHTYLNKTNDTSLDPGKIAETEQTHRLIQEVNEGYATRNFDQVIKASEQLLDINHKNVAALNNIGYALLQQKKYREAIRAFTVGADLEPYWSYTFCNRGYCRLQLGELNEALADIQSAYDMNPENAYSWRNMGAYYLATDDAEKALHYFEESERMDPRTDLINFYLGKAHLMLGNNDRAEEYFARSRERNEHNDSSIGDEIPG